MATAEFKTPKGATVMLRLVTERSAIADHNVVRPCWEMEVQANGKPLIGGWFGIVDHPAGRSLKIGTTIMRRPFSFLRISPALSGISCK